MTGPPPSGLWEAKVHSAFDETSPPRTLSGSCLDLVEDQKRSWPMLGCAYDALEKILERQVTCSGFSVRVQHNPARITSTLAEVTNGDTKGRACFLCSANLPAGQTGILYRGCYLILPNPMPVLPFHCTVASISHEPQAIGGRIGDFLALMVDLGPDWTVLYNGPRCGASAPDHFHFQIVPSGRMPIEMELRDSKRLIPSGQLEGVHLFRASGLGRQAVVLEGGEPGAMEHVFDAFLESLTDSIPGQGEPMMNIAGFFSEEHLSLVVFPRRKHRPDSFYKPGDEQIAVSPAVLEMGGILVTPVRRDFGRVDRLFVEATFAEVSLDPEQVEKTLAAILPASRG